MNLDRKRHGKHPIHLRQDDSGGEQKNRIHQRDKRW